MVTPPQPGYKALIFTISDLEPLLVRLTPTRFIMNMSTLAEKTTIASIEDTANLPYALEQLRRAGYLTPKGIAFIYNLETGGQTLYFPTGKPIANVSGIDSTGLREIQRYQGFISTHGSNNQDGQLSLEAPLLKPISNAAREISETLKLRDTQILESPKLKTFEARLNEVDNLLRKKKITLSF